MVKHSASGQSAPLSAEVFDRLFLTSRTHNAWMDKPLSDELMRELYDLAKDLGEEKNVAGDHPVVVARIETLLEAARTDSPHWPPKAGAKSPAKK